MSSNDWDDNVFYGVRDATSQNWSRMTLPQIEIQWDVAGCCGKLWELCMAVRTVRVRFPAASGAAQKAEAGLRKGESCLPGCFLTPNCISFKAVDGKEPCAWQCRGPPLCALALRHTAPTAAASHQGCSTTEDTLPILTAHKETEN